jgi:hypothetical protein
VAELGSAHEFAISRKHFTEAVAFARQLGTSVKMIEQHYGHLNPSMKADVIAGKRYTKKETVKQEEAIEEATVVQPKLKVVR